MNPGSRKGHERLVYLTYLVEGRKAVISLRNLPFSSDRDCFVRLFNALRDAGVFPDQWFFNLEKNFVSFKSHQYQKVIQLLEQVGICPLEDIIVHTEKS